MSLHWHPSLKTELNTVTVMMMIINVFTLAPLIKDRVEYCDSDDDDH